MHHLSTVYFVNKRLHVSGMFIAHHQEVCCICTTIGKCCAFRLTVGRPTNSQLKSTTRTNCVCVCVCVCVYIYIHTHTHTHTYCVSGLEYTKIHAYILVPKSFMKFMFLTVYRVTKKDFYARPYTSMWAPVVARQISKRYSSSCHVFIIM